MQEGFCGSACFVWLNKAPDKDGTSADFSEPRLLAGNGIKYLVGVRGLKLISAFKKTKSLN